MSVRAALKKCSNLLLFSAFLLIGIFSFVQVSFSENVRGVTDTIIRIGCVADQTGPIANIGIMIGESG
ncbi:MAG: hypothetical protein SVY10_20070, partial [Thermodesulfobacteriota bacterium]|nr:hypothetical protein [Thermodesulfobacteriota bacterium]